MSTHRRTSQVGGPSLRDATPRNLVGCAALAAFLLSVVGTFAGCGGGASHKPTVSIKRSQSGPSESANSESANGGSGGKVPSPGDKGNGGPAPTAGGYGTFTGRVVMTGTPPTLSALTKKGDPTVKDGAICAAMDVPDESIVVGADGGLKNVFVYLVKAPAGAKKVAPPEEAAVFDQKNCRFIPHAGVYRVGQTIKVLSADDVVHNTHTYPGNGDNPAINTAIPKNDREGTVTVTYVVSEKTPLKVKCDIHGYMEAYQLPLDHGIVAVTDENGKFEIKDVPSGEHEFIVWHEKAGYLDRKLKVSVSADAPTDKQLSYDAAKFKMARREPGRTVYLTLNH